MWMNTEVMRFLTQLDSQKSEEKCPLKTKVMRIEEAIKSGAPLTMAYRKADDQKVTIIVTPLRIGPMSYQGEAYLGMEGIFQDSPGQEVQARDKRVFRVDRIIDLGMPCQQPIC